MKQHYLFLSFFILVTLVLGCGSIPPTYYYRVDYTPDVSDNKTAYYPLTLGVAQFTTDILYESDKIVYRDSPYEAKFYHYRRWIAPPKKIVTEKVIEQYEVADLFEKVVRLPSNFKIDYILKGNIDAFEEWDDEDKWFGIVSIDFVLQDASTKEIVWENMITQKTEVVKNQPVEVVKAISMSLNVVVQQSITEIKENLKLTKNLSN